MSDPTATGFIGRSVLRREDHRLLRGCGVFVGDLQLPGMLHAAIVRSDHAHAGRRDPSTQLLQPLAGGAGEEARPKDGEQRLLVTEAVGEAPYPAPERAPSR